MLSYPFRIYANTNLGSQFDDTKITGEWLSSSGVGQARLLPDINVATGNVVFQSAIKTQETIGDLIFGFSYQSQNQSAPWALSILKITTITDSALLVQEMDGSLVSYTWDEAQSAFISPAGAVSLFHIVRNADGSFTHI